MKMRMIFPLLIVIMLLSCGKRTKKVISTDLIKMRFGSVLHLPQNVGLYCLSQDSILNMNIILTSNIKIVTYIDGNCSNCISKLKEWQKFILEESLYQKVRLVIYVYTDDITKFKHLNERYIRFPMPLLIDFNKSFYSENKLTEDKMLQTFLIDRYNKVILVGNPLYSKNLKDLYKEEITKRFQIEK